MSVALRGGGDINTVRAECSGSQAVLLREHSQVRVRVRVRAGVRSATWVRLPPVVLGCMSSPLSPIPSSLSPSIIKKRNAKIYL